MSASRRPMRMNVTFHGAARTVTGSMHELQVNGRRYLLDCGLYQGRRQEANERNRRFPFPPAEVDAVVLSHAHIDHSGNLPSLVKHGFAGPIRATAATADLCRAMLPDSAYLQEKDAAFVNKRRHRRRLLETGDDDGEVQPLYTVEDVERTLPLFTEAGYHQTTALDDNVSFHFHDAGHLLGSASVLLEIRQNGRKVKLAFSGDIGRPSVPILRDPEPLEEADYLILESTYGNRLHKQNEVVLGKLAGIVNRTAGRGGKIIIPAFAVGRTQQLVLMFHQLCQQSAIPAIPVFVDSPLAINATEVYRRHKDCYDEEAARFLEDGWEPFGFQRLRYTREVSESKALNDLRGPVIIISASGMCEAGRILHHLRNNIEDPRNTVLIAGFQAEHTLGRKLVDKLPEVAIFGEPVRLRAEVVTMNEMSGHADQRELLAWVKPLARSLKKIFLVHGEPSQAEGLAAALRETYRLEVAVPARGDSVEL